MPDDDFARLMAQVQQGSEEAVQELLERYGDHIYMSIRRRLNRELRSKFDSDDFAQAVWASFFANRDALLRFGDPNELAAFLARVAANKVIDEFRRRFATAKHNLHRERSLDRSAAVTAQTVPAATATPSQMAIAKEQWDRLTDGQPEPHVRIVEMRANGATYDEIASELKVDEKTVRRTIRRLARRIVE